MRIVKVQLQSKTIVVVKTILPQVAQRKQDLQPKLKGERSVLKVLNEKCYIKPQIMSL